MSSPRVVLLSGAQAPDTRSGVLFDAAATAVRELGFDVEVIAVRELPTVSLLAADLSCPRLRAAVDTIRAADALIVATPIHRASFSGLVQSVLDLLPKHALANKAVFPLAVGGSQGQVVALDYTLRPLLQARGATRVLDGHFVPERAISTPSEGGQIEHAELDALRASLGSFGEAMSRRRGRALAS